MNPESFAHPALNGNKVRLHLLLEIRRGNKISKNQKADQPTHRRVLQKLFPENGEKMMPTQAR